MTKDLYTPKEIAQIRGILIQEQDQLCGLSGVHTAIKDFHTDHDHNEEQLVRAALHKSCNTLLGRIENLEFRYLNHWYPHGLPAFLRATADYIERYKTKPNKRWRHLNWMKKAKTKFNALNEKQKDAVLIKLGQQIGNNSTARKANFNKALLTREYSYDIIRNIINKVKGTN